MTRDVNACEWDDAHGKAFASVLTTGFCGGDVNSVCASCFLERVQVNVAPRPSYDWGTRRWIPDEPEPVTIMVEGEWKHVSVEEAIERAKALTGKQVVTWSELT